MQLMFYEHKAVDFRINRNERRKSIIKSENKTTLLSSPEQKEKKILKKNQIIRIMQSKASIVQQRIRGKCKVLNFAS